MESLIIQLFIIVLVCGFAYWVYLQLAPHIPIAEPFKGVLNALVLILVGFIVLFYAIIPLLKMLPRMLH